LLHQQMHVSWIHRAYRGGIRLMFASATDNELLDMLYHRGYNYFGDPTPVPSATHNADSARRQIEFIRRLASANESWLEVVSTSRDARRAIQQGKLALVLSVELDNLTPAQVCALRDTGVRHIVPIHFANNAFGGTAVTGPVVLPPGTPGANPFNVANWWLSGGPGGGQYFSLVRDWRILYREGRPEYLHYHRFDFLQGGAVEPRPVSDAIFAGLGYASGPTSWGHRNARGADVGLIFNLMRQGFMIDLSHMSEVSAEDTVSLAQLIGFPLMSSHTGLRSDTAAGSSERQLLERHARAIASLGGVIGLGTGRSGASDQLLAWAQTYSDARRVLGSASIALGTDFNGLQEQMTTTGRTSTYPIQVAARRAPLGLAATAPALTQHVLGTRVFNGLTDGLAHYGMIPEFLQAVESTPPTPAGRLSGSTIVDELFQSAEATLVYWERVEEATQRLWGGAASCP
jgi:microsomal dipeptidase-like Zn-dependent dipeptidase